MLLEMLVYLNNCYSIEIGIVLNLLDVKNKLELEMMASDFDYCDYVNSMDDTNEMNMERLLLLLLLLIDD